MTDKIINRLCPENHFDKYLPRSSVFRTIREILRIFKSKDAGQNSSKRFFIVHLCKSGMQRRS